MDTRYVNLSNKYFSNYTWYVGLFDGQSQHYRKDTRYMVLLIKAVGRTPGMKVYLIDTVVRKTSRGSNL